MTTTCEYFRMLQTLPTLSNTRWLSRIDSISTLLVHFENIYDAVSEIKDESTGQSAADASSFLFAMENFEFIIVACLTQYILAFIRPLSVNLQAKSCDLILAYSEARNLIQILSTVRSSATDYNKIYNRAVSIASKIDVLPQKPRTVGRQRHRANAGDDTTVFEHYRLNHFLPFVDHVVQHLMLRFPEELNDVLLGMYLLPGHFEQLNDDIIEKDKGNVFK